MDGGDLSLGMRVETVMFDILTWNMWKTRNSGELLIGHSDRFNSVVLSCVLLMLMACINHLKLGEAESTSSELFYDVDFQSLVYFMVAPTLCYQMHDRFPSKSRTKPQGDHEVGGASCSSTNGGPSNVNVELLDSNGNVVSSVLTSVAGSCSIINIIPGWYILRASHNDLNIEVKGSTEVELGFGNIQVDDIFFVSGYDICGSVVAQVTLEEVGLMLRALRYSSDVHIYVASG
ncbi:hypothetical protein Tco_1169685 [Tanacetum coccineum]